MGKEAIFTIEFPDGRTYTGAVTTALINVETSTPVAHDNAKAFPRANGHRAWEIKLCGIEPLTAMQYDDDLWLGWY